MWWEQRCYENEMFHKAQKAQDQKAQGFPPRPPVKLPTSSEDLWFGVQPPPMPAPAVSFQEACRRTCVELGIDLGDEGFLEKKTL